MGGTITCSTDGSSEASVIVTLLTGGSVLQDKDPYDGGLAVVSETPTKARGNVVLTPDDTAETILLTTCWDKDCAEDALTTTVSVGE